MNKIKDLKTIVIPTLFSLFVLYAGDILRLPEKSIRNEIIKYESPIISQKDFSKYKNILPSLPEGSTAISFNNKNEYKALVYQKRVTLMDSYYPALLKSIGGRVSTKYKNGRVTENYEIYLLAKNINSFEDCMKESRFKADRLLENFGWNWNSKQEFALVEKDTLAFKAEGFFLKKHINIGFKCKNKSLLFMVAFREPVYEPP